MKPITSDSLRKMAILAGLKDRTLAEKTIGEEYSLTQIIQTAISQETSRANVDAMQGLQRNGNPTYRVQKYEEQELDLQDAEVDARLNLLRAEMEELEVHKLRQAGKYSQRFKPNPSDSREKQRC